MINFYPAVIFSAGKIVWLALFVLMGQPLLALIAQGGGQYLIIF
jgi:hypothetical protein